MTGEAWAYLGSLTGGVFAIVIAVIKTRPNKDPDATENRSVSAGEVTALGARLDAQTVRMDRLERVNRGLYNYIAMDHAAHHANGWPILPIPEEFA